MVENKYNLLNVEELDNSTNNLPRKYNKLIKSLDNSEFQKDIITKLKQQINYSINN